VHSLREIDHHARRGAHDCARLEGLGADDIAGIKNGDDLAFGIENGTATGSASGTEVVLDEQAFFIVGLRQPVVGD
jgi:hypothetical protein